ncbi:hypothetical protein FQA39_LY00889 [Lamprigera yunnana]|nr:hypothetical protein FQA39_LY00889 [Lamprigera yunnana]
MRAQFAECIWHINPHVNNDRLRQMEDLWLYFEDPEMGYFRRQRYWGFNMHLGHVTNLNGIRPDVLGECWDLAIGAPLTEEELIQNRREGYVRPPPLEDFEDEESDFEYNERIRPDVLGECWDLAIGAPLTEEELIQNRREGYVRSPPLEDFEDEESDFEYNERWFLPLAVP